MYLVLIDNRIQNYQNIVSSLTSDTDYVIFDFNTDTIDTIKTKITKNYDSVGIIQHNYSLQFNYQFIDNSSPSILSNLEKADPELNTWQHYIDFLSWLKTERGANYIDLMACGLWADSNWVYMIQTVRSKYDIHIRASVDITGANGNFILESDDFNLIGVYFTEQILEYKYDFYYNSVSDSPGFWNYSPYRLPSYNLATVSSRYRNLLGTFSSTPYKDVVSVVSVKSATAILRKNGNVVLLGTTFTSDQTVLCGIMPCGIVTQSQLVNVRKIVGGLGTLCALKYDGTVVCWGFVNLGSGNVDINTVDTSAATDPNQKFVNVNSVRSQLNYVVDIYANSYNGFAALTSSGKLILWGSYVRGGFSSVASSYLSSGVSKVFVGTDSFVALKTDGTAAIIGGYLNSGLTILSTTYFSNATPIVDVLMSAANAPPLYIRQNGNTLDITTYTGTVYYTLPTGVTILKKITTSPNSQAFFFLQLSNQTVASVQNGTFSLLTNTTEVVVGDTVYGYIQNGAVVIGGNTAYGTFNLTNSTTGLKSGTNFTNPTRLVSSVTSVGVIKSDNTFNWAGFISAFNQFYSMSFPGSSTNSVYTNETTLYNSFTGKSISSIYTNQSGYLFSRTDGNLVTFGPQGPGGPSSAYGYTSQTTCYDSRDASTNIYFEVVPAYSASFVALEIPYAPLVYPTSIVNSVNSAVSYYVSNPDIIALIGRKYTLYNGATLLSTFYPLADTHTYVFSSVNISTNGTYTLTIKDETNPSTFTVTTFQMTVKSSVQPTWVVGGVDSSGAPVITRSYDSITWFDSSNAKMIFTNTITSVAFNGSKWVAGSWPNASQSSYYCLGYSSDGITWTGSTSATSAFGNTSSLIRVNGVTYANGLFVAVGCGNVNNIAYSTDGINWTGCNATTDTSVMFYWVVYKNSTWVAGHTNGLYSSSDGINWSFISDMQIGVNPDGGIGLDWNGLYWVSSTLYYSTDLVNWVDSNSSVVFPAEHCVKRNNAGFIAGGKNAATGLLVSPDGVSWSITSYPNVSTDVRMLEYHPYSNMWILGQNTGNRNQILYSMDGQNWTVATSNTFYGTTGFPKCVASSYLVDYTPQITSVTKMTRQINGSYAFYVNFTPGTDGIPRTYYYSTDGGNTYTDSTFSSGPLIISGISTGVNYPITIYAANTNGNTAISNIFVGFIPYPCFLEGTKILRFNTLTDVEEYVPVETLRRGDMIKTFNHDYKAIECIGYREIKDPQDIPNKSSRLYWLRKSKIPGMRQDLCITGDHCVLHKNVDRKLRESICDYMGEMFVTEDHYRVPAFLDSRAESYEGTKPVNIWHFALENSNEYFNYGVMANGLLVESCSLEYLVEKSEMTLI